MTEPTPESAQFEAVLDELRALVSGFQMIGVGVMLVGGQVLSLEARAAVIEVRTPTDIVDADEANNPAGFTRLPAGDLAFARAPSSPGAVIDFLDEVTRASPLS